MEIISFDVCGKFAHFRKYYANNTAFSYSIPPRTTIMGMLAAILGYERDQYYQQFAIPHLRIGIRVLYPVKKNFHRLNFLSIKSRGNALEGTGDFTGAGGHIQTPFELVSGLHPGCDFVAYRIFIARGDKDNGEFQKIKTCLLKREQRFNLTLGTANFSAWIENIYLHDDINEQQSPNMVKIHSAAPSENIGRIQLPDTDAEDSNYLEEELMPADFISNGNRELSRLIRMIFSTQGKPFLAELNSKYFPVPDNEGNPQNILFFE